MRTSDLDGAKVRQPIGIQGVHTVEEVVKQAQFILVLGRFERDGGVLNVVGRKFKPLRVREIVHRSHDFR